MAMTPAKLTKAVTARQAYIIENQSTLTMKAFRRLLEKDMGLPDKSLRSQKDLISKVVDQIVKDEARKKEITSAAKDSGPLRASEAQAEKKAGKAKKRETEAVHNKPVKRLKKDGEAKKPVQARREEDLQEAGEGCADEEPAVPSQHAKLISKMKLVCKHAGIKVPPSLYSRNKDGKGKKAALEELLKKHGLKWDSPRADIVAAKRAIERTKDLEGIEARNIIEGGRRSRGRVDYSQVLKPKYEEISESEEDDSDTATGADGDGDGSDSDAPNDSDSDAENVRPTNGTAARKAGRVRKSTGGKPRAEESESEAQASEDDATASGESGPVAGGSDDVSDAASGSEEEEEEDDACAEETKKRRRTAADSGQASPKADAPIAGRQGPSSPSKQATSSGKPATSHGKAAIRESKPASCAGTASPPHSKAATTPSKTPNTSSVKRSRKPRPAEDAFLGGGGNKSVNAARPVNRRPILESSDDE